MSRPCCDRYYRLQSPSRDGSRGPLSPKIGDFRDDENSRTMRSKGGLSAWRDKPRLAGLRRAVTRRRHRPTHLASACCGGRRPTGRRRLPSPRSLRSRGSRLPLLIPPHTAWHHRETVRAACSSGLPGCDSRCPAREARGTRTASRRPAGPLAARADRRRFWACCVRFIRVASDRSRGFISGSWTVNCATRLRTRSKRVSRLHGECTGIRSGSIHRLRRRGPVSRHEDLT